MSKYIGPQCKLCRAEGLKLFLKGAKCYTDKCPFDRRKKQGKTFKKYSEYGMQLREKQKIKRYYGVLEKQFRRYFQIADRKKGITGENLLVLLERRLDNVVYNLGFASSRRQARNMISHGFFAVNGKRVTIPSFLVRENDEISVLEKYKENNIIKESLAFASNRNRLPEWLQLDSDSLKGTILRMPERKDITMPFKEHMVVELYSK